MSKSIPIRDWKSQFYDSAFANPAPDPLQHLKEVQNTSVLGSSKHLSIKSLKASCQAIVKLSQEGSTYYSSIRSHSSVTGSYARETPELTPLDKVATWATEPYSPPASPPPTDEDEDETSVRQPLPQFPESEVPQMQSLNQHFEPSNQLEKSSHSNSITNQVSPDSFQIDSHAQQGGFDHLRRPVEANFRQIKPKSRCRGGNEPPSMRQPQSDPPPLSQHPHSDQPISRPSCSDIPSTRRPHHSGTASVEVIPQFDPSSSTHSDQTSLRSPQQPSPNRPPNSFTRAAASDVAPPRRPRRPGSSTVAQHSPTVRQTSAEPQHSSSDDRYSPPEVRQAPAEVCQTSTHINQTTDTISYSNEADDDGDDEMGELNEDDYNIIEELKEVEKSVNRIKIYMKNVPDLPMTKDDINTRLLQHVDTVYELIHNRFKIIADVDRKGSSDFYKKYNGYVLDYSESKVPLIVYIVD